MKDIKPDMNFFIPVEFEKATTKKGEKIMKIKGVASTADVDSEGEILDPMGFDLSRFLSGGFLNWNHQSKTMGAQAIIGEPTSATVNSKGELEVTGILYSGHPLAESVWNLAETLERNNSKRRLGFSIEGRATERDIVNPKKITKATLTGLAVTHVPVNTNTYLDLVKGTQKQDFTEYEDDILQKAENSKYIFEFSCDSKKYGITKSFEVEELIEKAEGDRGGLVIGHTLSGKPIYKKSNGLNTKDYSSIDHHNAMAEHDKLRGRLPKFSESGEKNKDYEHHSKMMQFHKQAAAAKRYDESTEKSMTTSNTAALVPESLDGKKIKLTPEIRKAVMNGLIPIEKLLKKIKK